MHMFEHTYIVPTSDTYDITVIFLKREKTDKQGNKEKGNFNGVPISQSSHVV